MPTFTASPLRSIAFLFPLLGALSSGGCSAARPISLRVVGGTSCDPFAHGMADQARVTLQGLNVPVQTVAVAADGTFHLQLTPSDLTTPGRILIEALHNGMVIGTGATPYLPWGQLINQQVSVEMHCLRGLVRSDVSFATGHADFRLWPYGSTGPLVATASPGTSGTYSPEGYDLFELGQAAIPTTGPLPTVLDGDTSVIPVTFNPVNEATSARTLLLHGMDNYWWPPDSAASLSPYGDTSLPAERASLVGAGTLGFPPESGGFVVGGRAGTQRSTRVDQIIPIGSFAPTAPQRLRYGRTRPDLLELQRYDDSTATMIVPEVMLVSGGQAVGDPALELYRSSAGDTPGPVEPLLPASAAGRTAMVAVCVPLTGSTALCPRVLLLGGLDSNGMPTQDDLLLDGGCLLPRASDPTHTDCNPFLASGSWLTVRRWGGHAAVSEGGDVVVAGGFERAADGTTILSQMVDVVDASNPDAPAAAVRVGPLTASDPAVLALPNGSVMIAGGLSFATNQPDTAIWFYRR